MRGEPPRHGRLAGRISRAARTRRVQRSMASDLISKLLAAGLSAGLFLIWWPEHHATTGLASLALRGALWTLTFELLLLAFAPLERHVARLVRERVELRRPDVRIGGACALACVGAAVPLALL